jgi:Na+/H+-dicarboxylate symporter
LESYRTVLTKPENATDGLDVRDWDIGGVYIDGTNMIGVVSLSVIFAITMGAISKDVKKLLVVILEFNDVMMKLIELVIWITPVGIFFLILAKFIEIEDIGEIFSKLGLYVATVVGGHLAHSLIILPLIYFAILRKNPYKFLGQMSPAIIAAFGTASSLATLPLSLKCIEENVKVDKRVTRFMIPLGELN